MKKINSSLAVINISIFIIELFLIMLSDFSDNAGTTKGVAITYFIFGYIWYCLPSVFYLFFKKKILNNSLLIIIFIVNTVIFFYSLSMLLAYLGI